MKKLLMTALIVCSATPVMGATFKNFQLGPAFSKAATRGMNTELNIGTREKYLFMQARIEYTTLRFINDNWYNSHYVTGGGTFGLTTYNLPVNPFVFSGIGLSYLKEYDFKGAGLKYDVGFGIDFATRFNAPNQQTRIQFKASRWDQSNYHSDMFYSVTIGFNNNIL